jgi:hypothetical protein
MRTCADHHAELAFVIDALVAHRPLDQAAGRQKRRARLEEHEGFLGDALTHLERVRSVVLADTDDLAGNQVDLVHRAVAHHGNLHGWKGRTAPEACH